MATIHIDYIGDLRTDCEHLQSGTHINTDAPTDNQGKGEAFSPTDLVANALGTCIITTMAINARRDGIDLTGSKLDVTKIMTTQLPRKIARIEINLTLQANREGVSFLPDDETRARLERIAHTCPVALCLHADVEQAVHIQWEESIPSNS
ncbi:MULTISPECIES: OsmC family protein [unclassified Spirosoma]|uniref:OsmC family protein n=1 Tax=unclassified Spirosoma TaxID=2621999 RepID=UPI0009683BAA|nr:MULTISPECIES: OsmC family protein [unclassified Spirosoma]MBN8823907.1 OsmC family protein [Spirosoma sp.]OJW79702.1 MAG: osmotically inducible protein OsmC [Spirosoma sp. 48-14]